MTDVLTAMGDAFGTRNANARSTAALLSNPGCGRRAILDAARVDTAKLAKRLGAPQQFGQSPFAIGQGNRFERQVKDNDYEALIAAINDLLGIFDGVTELRSISLEGFDNERRAEKTADVLRAIANGDPDAPHVVDHGMTRLDVGGNTVYLEQDAMAFREGERLRICEIKGFPIIDGTASASKVGAAARQTAVYVASIQDTLAARGFDPGLVSSEVVLVCPKNFGITPIAVKVDVDREVRALRRQLRRRANIGALVATIALAPKGGAALDALLADAAAAAPGSDADRIATQALVERLPYRYSPECLSNCDLARHCRSCAQAVDDPARLGGDVSALLGGIDTVAAAMALVDGAAATPGHAEVAELLRAAGSAIDEVIPP